MLDIHTKQFFSFSVVHGMVLSLRQLKRKLKGLGLRRRAPRTAANLRLVSRLVWRELSASGVQLGYRALWRRIRRKYKAVVSRKTVMMALRQIDPVDSMSRKQHKLQRRVYYNKGPNYVWHIDGYDKLKPFGFSVHGCIDGFSRRIIWLEVGTTNNDPGVIAYYYIQSIKLLQGINLTVDACINKYFVRSPFNCTS
jgi:hypothetical protein